MDILQSPEQLASCNCGFVPVHARTEAEDRMMFMILIEELLIRQLQYCAYLSILHARNLMVIVVCKIQSNHRIHFICNSITSFIDILLIGDRIAAIFVVEEYFELQSGLCGLINFPFKNNP